MAKKEGNSFVYKMPGGADPYPPESVKRVIPRGWGSLMRSKTYREGTCQEGEKNVDIQEKIGLSSRKSVSSIMEMKSSSRSSVSQVENNNSEIQEKVVVSSRKSVSSISDRVKSSRSSVSLAENNNVRSVAGLLNVKVLVSDMPGFMQLHAFRCARTTFDSLDKFSSKHMAFNMKKEFDRVYGPTWHCIVGSSFGSFVTHATGGFLYFSMEKLYILVFKTKIQKPIYSS